MTTIEHALNTEGIGRIPARPTSREMLKEIARHHNAVSARLRTEAEMSNANKGERVPVEKHVYIEAWIGDEKGLEVRYGDGRLALFDADSQCVPTLHLRAEKHPGVPVEDLLEELELATRRICGAAGFSEPGEEYAWRRADRAAVERANERYRRWNALRAAREAAQKPKPKEGHDVWVRGKAANGKVVVMSSFESVGGESLHGEITLDPDPDDIRTDPPDGGKRDDALDAARFRWLLDGNGYFMEEESLCGHAPTSDAQKDRARREIDEAMLNDRRET